MVRVSVGFAIGLAAPWIFLCLVPQRRREQLGAVAGRLARAPSTGEVREHLARGIAAVLGVAAAAAELFGRFLAAQAEAWRDALRRAKEALAG